MTIGDGIHLGVERGIELLVGQLGERAIAEALLIAEDRQGISQAGRRELECHVAIIASGARDHRLGYAALTVKCEGVRAASRRDAARASSMEIEANRRPEVVRSCRTSAQRRTQVHVQVLVVSRRSSEVPDRSCIEAVSSRPSPTGVL
jgi:hypothetical protein